MNQPTIPAPERDLQNVDPEIPPASAEPSSATRLIMATWAIGMGLVILVIAAVAALFHASPLPRDVFNADEISAAFTAGACGLCLIGCGISIRRRSTIIATILLVLAVVFGVMTTTIA